MAVSYKKLCHLLIERDLTFIELQKKANYSANITTKLKKNDYISMESLEKICNVLHCGVDEILTFSDREEENND